MKSNLTHKIGLSICAFIAIVGLSSCGTLQRSGSTATKSGSDSAFDNDDSSSNRDDGLSDLEDKSSKSNSKLEDRDVPSSSGSITRDDLKRLSDAKRMKAEPNLLAAASEILSKDPNHLETLNLLGVFYFERKQLGLSKIILKRALKNHPNEPGLYNNLGIIYLAENEINLAIDSFKKSVAAKSSYKTGATNLSSIYLEYGDYKRSLEPLEASYRALRSDISRGSAVAVEVANNYAVALMGVGDNDKAGKVFAELDSAGARNPIPFLNYAILLIEVQKNKKDAIRVISKLKFMTEDRGILNRVSELESKM